MLSLFGYEMVEKIGTPVSLISHPRIKGFFRVIWGDMVSGDIRAIDPDTGRSVLAEVKTYEHDRLQYSVLKKHQHEALRNHTRFNGISFLIWVHPQEIFIMQYPIPGFEPRKSLTLEMARKYTINRIEEMSYVG